MLENYKDPKIRNEIKERILAELEKNLTTHNLPILKKWTYEIILSNIQAWERYEKRIKRKR